ncbi:MAG: hypothetical protein MJZ24_02645 [Paludibacteraceae bacterium]|nr:hypothetical protein [Paludibacteraceae bacterium]
MAEHIQNREEKISVILDEIKELEMLTKGFENPEMLKQLALKKAQHLIHLYEGMDVSSPKAVTDDYEFVTQIAAAESAVLSMEEDTPLTAEEPETEKQPKEDTEVEATVTTEQPVAATVEAKEEKRTESTPLSAEKKPFEQKPNPTKSSSSSFSRMESQFVTSLKSAIKLNDRIRYKKELFDNNMNLLDKTIEDLDKQSNLEDAMTYIHHHFLHWDNESDAVEDFLTLLEKRFSNK